MSDTLFLKRDPELQRLQIVQELYRRLHDTRHASALIALNDFDAGINCRCADEEQWLLNLLDKIERS
jgi:hypothetical protein